MRLVVATVVAVALLTIPAAAQSPGLLGSCRPMTPRETIRRTTITRYRPTTRPTGRPSTAYPRSRIMILGAACASRRSPRP